jgi:hypothetical protein
MFESIVFWLGPVLAFETAMFVLIFVVARAILREEHGQEAQETDEGLPAATPSVAKLAA